MINHDFRKVKNISKDMENVYKDYYLRNTFKFFNKWRFTENDLGTIFTKENEEYVLIGQVTDSKFFFKKEDDDTRWFIDGNFLIENFSRKGG